MLSLKKLNLNNLEKRTYRLHMAYSFIEGIILGIFILNDFVLLKSLNGSNYQLSMLFTFSMVVFIFLIISNEFLKRIKNRKRLLRIVAILTRGPLILFMFFPETATEALGQSVYTILLLVLFFIYYTGFIIIKPSINLFLKNSYSHGNFGVLFSYATSINKITMLAVTFFFGILLDFDNYAFTYVYPVISLLGIVSVFLLAEIEYKLPQIAHVKQSIEVSVKSSVKSMFHILKSNKPFRDFEIGFMFYGFAFMISVNVITIFFKEALDVNYTTFAFYKNFYNILAIVLLPVFGKLLGQIDPRKFAAITFLSLLLHYLFFALTEYFPGHFTLWNVDVYYMLIISYLSYSVFAATMGLLWSIGSAYFCKKEDAGEYQSIHLSLVGVRALFAPVLGVMFYEIAGFTFTFSLAVLACLIAVFVMIKSIKKQKLEPQE